MSRFNRAPLLTRMADRPSQDTVPLEVAREAEKRAKTKDLPEGWFSVGRVNVSPRYGGHGYTGTGTQWEFFSDDPEVRARMAGLPEIWPGRLTGLSWFYLLQGPLDTPRSLAVVVAMILDAPEWQPELFCEVIKTMLEYHEMIEEWKALVKR